MRLEPVAGEALDSWIEALARCYRIAARPMLGILGIGRPPTFARTLMDRIEPAVLRRFEQAAGVAPGRLGAAVDTTSGWWIGFIREVPGSVRPVWPPLTGAGRIGGA